MKLLCKKLSSAAKLPEKAYSTDMGLDLFAAKSILLYPNTVTLVPTDIACEFPNGYGAIIRDRSSMATRVKIFVVAGIIDETYRGNIQVAFYNPPDNDPIQIVEGQKIAQMILMLTPKYQVLEVTELSSTERSDKGFGSSGS